MATYKVIDGNNVFRRRFEKIGATALQVMYHEALAATPEMPIIWVWDGAGAKASRQAIYPGYKAKREGAGDHFHKTVELFQTLLTHSPACQLQIQGIEADDVIAALVPLVTSSGDTMIIDSNDADFLVLQSDLVRCERDKIEDIDPRHMRLYKTLVGDKSDEIPGIKGFGDKAFKDLEESEKQLLVAHFEGRQTLTGEDCKEMLGWTPAKVKAWDEEQENLKAYWQVIGFIPVDPSVIQAHLRVGTPNKDAAAQILNQFIFTMDPA